MSHLPERKEKICLNCGAALHGRFCHYCGQENIAPKDSFWHLVTHFVYDIIHFDGKFFSTLKYLLFKPGFLSHEYLRGRRADYLHPIRMYVFTSAFFFLIFFSFYKAEDEIVIRETKNSPAEVMKKLEKHKTKLEKQLKRDSVSIAAGIVKKTLAIVESDIDLLKKDSTRVLEVKSIAQNRGDFKFASFDDEGKYESLTSVKQYDSIQASLPKEKRDNFFVRTVERQNIHLREKYKGDGRATYKAITNKFMHLFPQMLFVSLPMFALILQLLYARRKAFYYVNHVIYSIHLYCAIFIIILSGLWLNSLLVSIVGGEQDWIGTVFTIAGFFYLYKSMRNFYGQRRAKTILKYFLLLLASLVLMTLIFVVFFFFSAFSI